MDRRISAADAPENGLNARGAIPREHTRIYVRQSEPQLPGDRLHPPAWRFVSQPLQEVFMNGLCTGCKRSTHPAASFTAFMDS
jgi:hypothetical protein